MILKNIRVKSIRVTETNDNGKYQLIFAIDDKKERKAFVKLCDKEWEESDFSDKKADYMPYFISEASEEYPADEDTGKELFICSQNATNHDETKSFSVGVYDATGRKLTKEEIPSIGAGTILNLNTSFYAWSFGKGKKAYGLKANFNSIQIVDLKEYTGGDAGFEATEGYKAQESNFSDEAEPKKKKKKKGKK